MPEEPSAGRVYRSERRIRLSDTAVSGRLRLDAVARYLQDIALDDVADAGIGDDDHIWVVRRLVIDIQAPLLTDQSVALATWASGAGPHWAARRTRLAGDAGGRIETETVWVYIDRSKQRLERLPLHFFALYGEAASGRQISGKLSLAVQPPPDAEHITWPLRVTDIDILGHVNNAAYWEAIESIVALEERPLAAYRAVMEYRRPIDLDTEVTLRVVRHPSGCTVWFSADGATAAVATLTPLT